MQILKSPMVIAGKMLMILGMGSFLIFGTLEQSNTIILAVYTSIFLGGLFLYLQAKWVTIKEERLKKDGLVYNLEILKIVPIRSFKIKGYFTFYAECRYNNEMGEPCFLRSRLVTIRKSKKIIFFDNSGLLPEIEYHANAYVNRENSQDYVVEVSAKLKSNLWFN